MNKEVISIRISQYQNILKENELCISSMKYCLKSLRHSSFYIDKYSNLMSYKKLSSLSETLTDSSDFTTEKLFDIYPEKEFIKIVPSSKLDVYKVLNYENKHRIKEDDVIKLDQNELKILYISFNNNPIYNKKQISHYISNDSSYIDNCSIDIKNERPSCRICKKEDISIGNILFKPCQCKEKDQYIHSLCIKQYLKKNLNKISENEEMCLYNTKSIICNKCNSSMSVVNKILSKNIDLMGFNNNYENYIIVQINKDEIIVLNLKNKKEILIGSNDKCLLKFQNENEINKIESKIVIKKNELFIQKCLKSKFGNLVLLKKPIFLSDSDTHNLKIGDHLIEIKKKSKNWFIFC